MTSDLGYSGSFPVLTKNPSHSLESRMLPDAGRFSKVICLLTWNIVTTMLKYLTPINPFLTRVSKVSLCYKKSFDFL